MAHGLGSGLHTGTAAAMLGGAAAVRTAGEYAPPCQTNKACQTKQASACLGFMAARELLRMLSSRTLERLKSETCSAFGCSAWWCPWSSKANC